MAKASIHFLIVYDLAVKQIVSTQEFADSAEAVSAYQKCEQDMLDNDDIEIVLVGADSIETVKATHRSYFEGSASRVGDYFKEALLTF